MLNYSRLGTMAVPWHQNLLLNPRLVFDRSKQVILKAEFSPAIVPLRVPALVTILTNTPIEGRSHISERQNFSHF